MWLMTSQSMTRRHRSIITTVPITGRIGAGGGVGSEHRRIDRMSRRLVVGAPQQADRNLDGEVNHDGHRNGDVELHAKALLQSEQDAGADQHRDNPADAVLVHWRAALAFGSGIAALALSCT